MVIHGDSSYFWKTLKRDPVPGSGHTVDTREFLVPDWMGSSSRPRDKDGCTPNVRVPMVFIVFSRDSWGLQLITHKYPRNKRLKGFPIFRGTLWYVGIGVHPCLSPESMVYDPIQVSNIHEAHDMAGDVGKLLTRPGPSGDALNPSYVGALWIPSP